MKGICDSFPISNEEYLGLEKEFGKLTKYASWQLLRKNAKNNHTDDFEDINQELTMSLIRAGSYYKRQVYIEKCLIVSLEFVGTSEAFNFLEFLASEKDYKGLSIEAKQALIRMSKRNKQMLGDGGFSLLVLVLQELVRLWHTRTRHGANRQKFGSFQEKLLHGIVKKVVPVRERPRKNMPLEIDEKFSTYCKAIAWNAQKSLGRKITKEKSIRSGIASLSDFDYLGGE